MTGSVRTAFGFLGAVFVVVCSQVACNGTDEATPPEADRLATRPIPLRCVDLGPRPGLAKPVRLWPQLAFDGPVQVLHDPKAGIVYVVEVVGRVRRFSDRRDVAIADVIVDVSSRIWKPGIEDGLLGVALERDASGAVTSMILKLTMPPTLPFTKDRVVVARIQSRDGGASFAGDTFEELLSIDSPNAQHHGGPPAFGPDGFLYVPVGDGGIGFSDAAEDLKELRGKILRIDVHGKSPYAIPPSNPFVGRSGVRPEIFARGFRNPFGWSFDDESSALWVGDVGDARFEELDRVTSGADYGWPKREGFACARPPCADGDSTPPLFVYPHAGAAAIVAGPVYRGARFPELVGRVIVGDYVGGRIDGISRTTGGDDRVLVDETGDLIISLATNPAGEIVFSDYRYIYELDRRTSGTPLPKTLSATGCIDLADPKNAPKGFVPYRIGMPLWSDGAEKARWLAIPGDKSMQVNPDDSLEVPVGTVAVKSFFWRDKPVETRLLVRHGEGDWAGYSYAWRDDGKDADLMEYGGTRDLGDLLWTFPTSSGCMGCHTQAAGRTLGLDIAQLNRRITVSGARVPQLEVFQRLGLLQGPLAHTALLQRFPRYEDTEANPATWSRAYLHANCSHCHREGAPGYGNMNFTYTSPLGAKGCNLSPSSTDLGLDGARILAPGAPDRSIVLQRMQSTEWGTRMPPAGTNKVDEVAVGYLRRWIEDLKTCD